VRGRKPKPTRLKLITGNPGKRPLNAREPKPAIRVPTCPAHLNPSAKAEWKRLARQMHVLGMISELDRAALAAYCQAYGRWAEAERKLKETPMLLKLPSGIIQQSPWLAIANKQLELMSKFMSELGAVAGLPDQGRGEAARAETVGDDQQVRRPDWRARRSVG
jgi:P27 family predicted phage terminase small subunit